MRRRTLVALVALVVLGSVAGLAALAPRQTGAAPIYTVAQVNTGVARNPAEWVGRIVQVRGRAVISINRLTAACCTGLLVDPNAPAQHIYLSWRAVSPLLTVLLGIPFVNALVARGIGGDKDYRVLITRVTRLVPAPGLPNYYPYTNKTVTVSEDRAVLVNGLN